MRRGCCVKIVQPGRSRRRWRVAGCRRRRTRAQRWTRRRTSVAFQVTVPSVSVAQRRHVLAWLRLWARTRLQVRAGLRVRAALTTCIVVVIVGQRTHHLAPRIVRQWAENFGRDWKPEFKRQDRLQMMGGSSTLERGHWYTLSIITHDLAVDWFLTDHFVALP